MNEETTKEVVCRICQKNRVKISSKGTSGVCLECVSGGAFVTPSVALKPPKKPRAKRGTAVKIQRTPRKNLLPWGELTAWVKGELMAGKATKDIYHAAMAKYPSYSPKALRSSVYT